MRYEFFRFATPFYLKIGKIGNLCFKFWWTIVNLEEKVKLRELKTMDVHLVRVSHDSLPTLIALLILKS